MQRTLHTSDPTRRSYLFHYASFVSSASVTVDIFFPALLWFLSAFLPRHEPDIDSCAFCPFYTWLCRVHWCWFDCLHMLYCFFCFFFVIDVDNKRPICHSHTVLQKPNVGDSAVAGDRRAAECCQIDKTTAWFIRRRVNELNRTVVFKLIIFQRGAEASPADVNVSNSHFVQVTSVFFVMCEFGTCLLRCFFLVFFLPDALWIFLLKYRLGLAAVL